MFFDGLSSDLHALCTTCNEARSAREERTAIATLYQAKFECPCGEEGNLHNLSRHRRLCRQSQREQTAELDLSQASASSSSSTVSSSSSSLAKKQSRIESDTPESIEFMVKGYIAQELSRMKEDIINTTRMERQTSEDRIQRALDRADYLESRVDYLSTLETRLETLERSPSATRVESGLASRLDGLDIQVQLLRSGHHLREVATQEFARLYSRSAFLWFDVKTLLRDFNRNRSVSESPDQSLQLAGYPCQLHMQIDQADGTKSLLLYMGVETSLANSANWPMRRHLSFKIFDTQGDAVFENNFSTTDPDCRDYFKGPQYSDFGGYFGVHMCRTEELTSEGFYQRNNGMICVGITISP